MTDLNADAPDDETPDEEMLDVFRGVELAAAPAERPSVEPWRAAWDEPSETLEGEGRSQSFPLPAEGRVERSKSAEDDLRASPVHPDFDGFFIEHWDWLLSQVRRFCAGDQALAEDVSQEAFLQAYRHREELFTARYPYLWLRVVAFNIARSMFRREGRRRDRERELHGLSPDEASEEVAQVLLLDIVDRLPDPERQIIRYRLVLGYERKRIAEIMNISLRTIDYHIHRALHRMRRALDLPEEG